MSKRLGPPLGGRSLLPASGSTRGLRPIAADVAFFGQRRDDLTALPGISLVTLSGARPYEISIDSLVMVDFINRHRASASDLLTAVRRAGVVRFRPIVLTSVTTFFALTPLLLEKSMQAKFLIPMAVSLAFGVMFATFITLVLVPAGYMALEDLKALPLRWRGHREAAGLPVAGLSRPAG